MANIFSITPLIASIHLLSSFHRYMASRMPLTVALLASQTQRRRNHEDAGLGSASSHSSDSLRTFHPGARRSDRSCRGAIRFSASRGPLILQVA